LLHTPPTYPPCNAGLPTTPFEMHLAGPLNGLTTGTLSYRDANFAGRIGWKEVIAIPASGTLFKQTDVPQTDQTNALTQYSPTAISTPLDRTSASLEFAPGIAPAPATSAQPQTVPSNQG